MVEKLCDRVAIMNRGQLMEIIDVKKFMAESKIPLETYFLNMTKDEKAKVIKYENKKEIKEKLRQQKREEKEKAKEENQKKKKENKEKAKKEKQNKEK